MQTSHNTHFEPVPVDAATFTSPEVAPDAINHHSDMQRLVQEMATWNRKQRRTFVRMTGGFKKHGRKW